MTIQPTIQTPVSPPQSAASDAVLQVRDLSVAFKTLEGDLRAVDQVSFDVPRGKTLALVGESGCGKSATAFSILRLIQAPGRIVGGTIVFRPTNGPEVELAGLPNNAPQLRMVRGGQIGMIFQEPMTALSPVHTIGNQLVEALRLHVKISKANALKHAIAMLGKVGIPGPEKRVTQYPFELSGGMRQRVVIAMAMMCDPQLLIADEPTTALDVTIQAQVMELIRKLQSDHGTATLLITHDMGVVAQMADEVAVMYLGRIVERGPTRQVLKHPVHPYTIGLLASLPSLAADKAELPSIPGSVPSIANRPQGCLFHDRCPHACAGLCDRGDPPQLRTGSFNHDHACLRADEIHGSKGAL